MGKIVLLAIVTSIMVVMHQVNSFASELTRRYCSLKLEEGEMMMNWPVVKQYTNSYSIKVTTEDGTLVANNSRYTYGQRLLVSMDPVHYQVVFDVSNAKFDPGYCPGKNRTHVYANATLIVPIESENQIVLTSVFARQYGQVQLTENFVLNPPLLNNIEL